jgi:hypothetical protein
MPLSPTIRLLLAGLAGLVIGAACSAAEIHGVISAIDLDKNELRIDGRGNTRGSTIAFTLDDKTLVLFGREKGQPADLKAGRRVRIEYEEDDSGHRLARVLRVSGRPGATSVATPVAAPAMPAGGDGITGTLQRVARSDREIVVIGPGPKGPETETTIAVPENAKIVREGKPSSLDALKEGDAVAVRVERNGKRVTALEVQVGPGAALSATPAQERGRLVPRIRQALHLADEVLRRMDPDGSPENPQKP